MATLDRRKFLQILAWAGLGATAAGGAAPMCRYVLTPWQPPVEGPSRMSLGPLDAFPPGQARTVILRGEPVLAIHGPEGVVAVSSRCTHFACLVKWNPDAGEIRCPCHGGRFASGGEVLGGPPPEPLEQVPVSIEDGEIWVGV